MSERDIVERLENAPSILNTPAEEWVEIVARDRKDARAEILQLRAQLAEARDAALEEAATTLESIEPKTGDATDYAADVRALKGQKP